MSGDSPTSTRSASPEFVESPPSETETTRDGRAQSKAGSHDSRPRTSTRDWLEMANQNLAGDPRARQDTPDSLAPTDDWQGNESDQEDVAQEEGVGSDSQSPGRDESDGAGRAWDEPSGMTPPATDTYSIKGEKEAPEDSGANDK